MVAQPHFLLFCDTHYSDSPLAANGGTSGYVSSSGRWHFVLEQLDGPERLEAADSEMAINRERLALLSVVRGLEALEQPSQVTLVTTSRYVSRGLRYGLNTWRESNYTWERFGEQRPVRNSDLWRRVDTALQFHGVKCRLIQAGQPAADLALSSAGAHASETFSAGSAPQLAAMVGTESVYAPVDSKPWSVAAVALSVPAAMPIGASANRHVLSDSARFDVGRELVLQGGRTISSANMARDLRGNSKYSPPSPNRWLGWGSNWGLRASWWNLAAAWMRWWRGRLQPRPAFYGT